VIIRKIEVTHL